MIKKYQQFFKFIVVAGVYNLFAYVIYVGLVFINCNYILASAISIIFGTCLSYYMNKSMVFKQGNESLVIRYVVLYLILLSIYLIMLRVFVQYLHINKYAAQILVAGFATLLSYNTMRVFVFRRK